MILVQAMRMMKTQKHLPNPDPEVLRLAPLAPPPPDPPGHPDPDPVQAPDPVLDTIVTREDGLGQGNG